MKCKHDIRVIKNITLKQSDMAMIDYMIDRMIRSGRTRGWSGNEAKILRRKMQLLKQHMIQNNIDEIFIIAV